MTFSQLSLSVINLQILHSIVHLVCKKLGSQFSFGSNKALRSTIPQPLYTNYFLSAHCHTTVLPLIQSWLCSPPLIMSCFPHSRLQAAEVCLFFLHFKAINQVPLLLFSVVLDSEVFFRGIVVPWEPLAWLSVFKCWLAFMSWLWIVQNLDLSTLVWHFSTAKAVW